MQAAVKQVVEARRRDLGGFEVRRILPYGGGRMVGPFIFLDHMGPAAFAPGAGIDVRPHPHIGLATVTYLFEGVRVHRDSLGCVQTIRPGDVNWMTAGSGIVHSERSSPQARSRGARLHGLQSWVALPTAFEEAPPAFHHHPADTLPALDRGGARLRVIAGSAYGLTSPVVTLSEMFYVDAELGAREGLTLPEGYAQRALYVVQGGVEIGGATISRLTWQRWIASMVEGHHAGRTILATWRLARAIQTVRRALETTIQPRRPLSMR